MSDIHDYGTKYLQIQCTFPSREEAEKVAAEILGARLVGCAQIGGPIQSIYRWEGKLENEQEWTLLAKTSRELFERLCQKIKSLHSYKCPQIIAVEIVCGSPDYLEWLDSQLD